MIQQRAISLNGGYHWIIVGEWSLIGFSAFIQYIFTAVFSAIPLYNSSLYLNSLCLYLGCKLFFISYYVTKLTMCTCTNMYIY